MRARALWLLKRAALLALSRSSPSWGSGSGIPSAACRSSSGTPSCPRSSPPRSSTDADWGQYLAAEQRIFDELRTEVTQKLDAEERVPVNRYFEGSPVYPGHFADDWNRSHVLEPDGAPVGAAVLLHGLTDAPYSQRHIGELYRDRGFVAIIPRLPGPRHRAGGADRRRVGGLGGGDPAGGARGAPARRPGPPLAHRRASRMAARSRCSTRSTRSRTRSCARPDRLVLISPMIGITAFARFAGIAGWPAVLPGLRQGGLARRRCPSSSRSSTTRSRSTAPASPSSSPGRCRRRSTASPATAASAGLPPILTFQSVVDFTVSTRAIITALYARLPANGSELVLFDLNRTIKFGPLLEHRRRHRAEPRPAAGAAPVPHDDPGQRRARQRRHGRARDRGRRPPTRRPARSTSPTRPSVFSLSHVALPFPLDDGLYGMRPDPNDDFGINLGAMATRGERGALIVSLEFLLRMTSNPFFPYMLERIGGGDRASALSHGAADRLTGETALPDVLGHQAQLREQADEVEVIVGLENSPFGNARMDAAGDRDALPGGRLPENVHNAASQPAASI